MGTKADLRTLIAKNIRYFMRKPGAPYKNANALAAASKAVSPNTVRNLLDPYKRTTTTEKPQGYPTVDKLEAVAQMLACEVWELLHPDIEKSRKERAMYRKIEEDFNALPPDPLAEEVDSKAAQQHERESK